MNETYDIIILGTGLKECILSGLLAKLTKLNFATNSTKILHLDRLGYYGSESASLNLTNLYKMFRQNTKEKIPEHYGQNKDWNVDLIPKFVMANGNLVKLLLKTNVSHYLEWKSIDGTYVYQWDEPLFGKPKGIIHKLPGNNNEALLSELMGLFEKNRCRRFFKYVQDFDINNPKTYNGHDPKISFGELVKKFELEPNTVDYIGHAVALQTNDDFLNKPACDTMVKMQLYFKSNGTYGDSPFIYPRYGLSILSEGFLRLGSLYNETHMLNTDVDEILYDDNGKFKGVKCKGQIAYGKICITDPSYVMKYNKVKSIGKVIRCICIMDHPVPKTNDLPSCHIILPQKQIKRNNDIFIVALNSSHFVCKEGYYLAIISTMVETSNPQEELKPALEVIGKVKETFITISDVYEPMNNSFSDNVFITSSFDSSCHFEEDTNNVIDLFTKITGQRLNLENEEKETKQKEIKKSDK